MSWNNIQSYSNQISNQASASLGTFSSEASPLQTKILGSIIPTNNFPQKLNLPTFSENIGNLKNYQITDSINKYGSYTGADGYAFQNINKNGYTVTNPNTKQSQEYDNAGKNKATGNQIGTVADLAGTVSNTLDLKQPSNKSNGSNISSFMSSGAGQAVSAAANIVGGVTNFIGNTIGAYKDRPEAQQLNEEQEAIRSGTYSMVSMIPGWGPLISAGLQTIDGLGKALGTQMSNISKDAAEDAGLNRGINNVVATIPGLGSVLGAFTKKTDEFKIDRDRLAGIGSAYDMSTFDSAEDLSGGKFLGQRNKVNSFIADQRDYRDMLTNMSDESNLRKNAVYTSSADISQQIRNKYSGISISKNGSKLPSKDWAKNLLNVSRFQNGGKTRSLKELKKYADYINPNFIQRANNPNLIGINFIDDKGNAAFGTHYMEVWDDGEGNYYVYPRIQEINGQLKFFKEWKEALNSALENKDYLLFDNLDEADNFATNYKDVYPSFQKFQNGGVLPGIETNVIPDGAYHAHKHHLEETQEDLGEITNKGIPVIAVDEEGNKQQIAEIEIGELILTKDLTDKLEQLYKDGSEDSMIQAGMLFSEELFNNTQDNVGGKLDE